MSVKQVARAPLDRILIGLLTLVVAALTVDIIRLLGINDADGGPRGVAAFETLAAVPLVLLVGGLARSRHRGETGPLLEALGAAVLAGAVVWACLWFLPRAF